MAQVPLKKCYRVEPIESLVRLTTRCATAINPGASVTLDANGEWVVAVADTLAQALPVYIAMRACSAGDVLTAMKSGTMDGFDLSALAFGAPVFVDDAASLGQPPGLLSDSPGTASVMVGRVVPATGNVLGEPLDKILQIDCPP